MLGVFRYLSPPAQHILTAFLSSDIVDENFPLFDDSEEAKAAKDTAFNDLRDLNILVSDGAQLKIHSCFSKSLAALIFQSSTCPFKIKNKTVLDPSKQANLDATC